MVLCLCNSFSHTGYANLYSMQSPGANREKWKYVLRFIKLLL